MIRALLLVVALAASFTAAARDPVSPDERFNYLNGRPATDSGRTAGRSVVNLLSAAHDPNNAAWTFSPTLGTGSAASAGSGALTITSTTDGSARLFTATTYASLVVGRAYALCATISQTGDAIGSFSLGLSTAPATGEQRVITSTNGRWCIRFTADATSEVIRVGYGITGNETTVNGDTVTISKVQIEEIGSITDVPNEFCELRQCMLDYPRSTSIASNVITVTAPTTRTPIERGAVVLVGGDSFCNDASEFADTLKINHRREVHKTCTSGDNLVQVLAALEAWVAAPVRSEAASMAPTVLVIEGGMNDLLDGFSAATIEANANAVIAFAKANNMIPIVVLPGPHEAGVDWSAGIQAIQDTYMASMLARTDVLVANMYTLLEDTANADACGFCTDGRHPNTTGSAMIAYMLDTIIEHISHAARQ